MGFKYSRIILSFTLLIILIGACSGDRFCNSKRAIVKIKNFEITQEEFLRNFDDLTKYNHGIPKHESALLIFDNLLSIGVASESIESEEYLPLDRRIERNLVVSQLIEKYLNKYDNIELSDKLFNELYCSNIFVDYIRVPSVYKDLSVFFTEELSKGAKIEELLNLPEKSKWDSLGLCFYHDATLESIILPLQVLKGITSLNVNDVQTIVSSNYTHIIYIKKKEERISPLKSRGQLALNLKKACAVEEGEPIFDDYVFRNLIQFNSEVYSNLNQIFSFPSLNDTLNDSIIGELNHVSFDVRYLTSQVSKLPVHLQALFRNKTSRTKAVATLILLSTSKFYPNIVGDKVLNSEGNRLTQNYLSNVISNSSLSDTIQIFKNWIIDVTNQFNTNSIDSVLSIEYSSAKAYKDLSSFGVNAHKLEISPEYLNINAWLNPSRLQGAKLLRLNYSLIENINFVAEKNEEEPQLVAKLYDWKLTNKMLEFELNRLTPKTRMQISIGDNLVALIRYLATGASQPIDNMYINYSKLKNIDVIGSSLDSLSFPCSENSVIASYNGMNLTISELRKIIDDFSQNEKQQFWDYESIKLNLISNELFNKYWLNKANVELCEADYIKAINKMQKFQAVNRLVQNQLFIKSVERNDSKLNVKFQTAVDMINNERLVRFLLEKSEKLTIDVDSVWFKDNFDIDISNSIYINSINSIPN